MSSDVVEHCIVVRARDTSRASAKWRRPLLLRSLLKQAPARVAPPNDASANILKS